MNVHSSRMVRSSPTPSRLRRTRQSLEVDGAAHRVKPKSCCIAQRNGEQQSWL